MTLADRMDSLSNAQYHIQELSNTLKTLGAKYINSIDVLDDIRRSIDIDEAMTEQTLNKQWEREQRALEREYYQSI